jgi:sortase A
VTPALLAGAALACIGLSVVVQRLGSNPDGRATGPAPVVRPAGGPAGGGGLVGALARHRWARRTLGVSAVLMVVGAVGALGYPMMTDRYTQTLQHKLSKQLISGTTRRAYRTHSVPVGASLTRIRIPKIGLDTVVVEGTTQSALRAGAGHYVDSPLPCGDGNVAIAGHRVTFGHPFKRMAELGPGDEIFLDTPVGSCTYRVATVPSPVDPSDVGVVAPTKDPELTLTTCHPEHSARQRLVLHARRVATHQERAQ